MFENHDWPWPRRPFDVVASDMDGDGDVDLVVNWHAHAPLQVFENRDGAFGPVDGPLDIPGVADLYGRFDEVAERVRNEGRSGLHVWHEHPTRTWHFVWQDDGRFGGFAGQLRSTERIEIEGLREDEVVQSDTKTVRLEIEGPRERAFHVVAGGKLDIVIEAGGGNGTPPLFVGPRLVRWPAAEAELWKPDPHGIAWVQVEGSPRPEIFVTRGGLAGRLRPPLPPKQDQYYVGDAGETPFLLAPAGVVPPGYGRGRRVECVDVDADGSLELSIANRQTPNVLLWRDQASGPFRDRAAELGLDFENAEIQAWADHDADGFDDLCYLEGARIRVARNEGGARFEPVSGLALELAEDPRRRGVFHDAVLRFADYDCDGDLDLWVLGYGEAGRHYLFRRDPGGFADVTREVGLESVGEAKVVVLLDVDNDGYEDAVSFGSRNVVWWNRGGERFTFHDLGDDAIDERVLAATALDADGDGWTDLVVVGRSCHLLRNTVAPGAGRVDVVLRDGGSEPIGAVVRAFHRDGRVVARRHGSAHSTVFSQGVQPLRFGFTEGGEIDRVGVRWPGEPEEELHAVSGAGRVVVERGD